MRLIINDQNSTTKYNHENEIRIKIKTKKRRRKKNENAINDEDEQEKDGMTEDEEGKKTHKHSEKKNIIFLKFSFLKRVTSHCSWVSLG